jgi:hypothetical protein
MTLEAYIDLLTEKNPELADLMVSKDVAIADSSIHYPEVRFSSLMFFVYVSRALAGLNERPPHPFL